MASNNEGGMRYHSEIMDVEDGRKERKGNDGVAVGFSGLKIFLPTCLADVVDALLREGRDGAQRSRCTSNGAGRPRVVLTRSRIGYDSDDEGGR